MAYDSFTGGRLSPTWNSRRVSDLHNNSEEDAMLGYLHMWCQSDFFVDVEEIKKDILVIYGDQDHAGFQKEAIEKGFSHYSHVHFLEIKNTGHYPMQEAPIYTATVIEKYLNQNAF